MPYGFRQSWNAEVVDSLTGTGDHTAIFAPGVRVKVHAVGLTITVATTGAVGEARFDKVDTAGTRGNGDGGVIAIANKAVCQVIQDTTSTIFPFVLNAGERLVPELTIVAGAGSGHYFVVYETMEDTDANTSAIAESA